MTTPLAADRPTAEPELDARDVLISFDHVSKKFCRHLRRSMAYGLLGLAKSFVGVADRSDTLRKGEFWAIDDLSFEMRRGDTLGVIGLNGSGKTTLLRMMAGIFPPDKGTIAIRGRVGTLISMGAGFHPHMTGRENIYVNGTILGMTRRELDAKFDEIVDFSEVGQFLDAPVSTYSSGMRVRLGFAIATAIVPDILLLDEVFAVGDVVFRQRCIERIEHITDNAAVILVTNRPEFVEMLCDSALWIDNGRMVEMGHPEDLAARYTEENSRRSAMFAIRSGGTRDGNGDIRFIDQVTAVGSTSGTQEIASHGEDLIVDVGFACHRPWSNVRFEIAVIDLMSGRPLTAIDCEVPEISANGTLHATICRLPLAPRSYALTLRIMHDRTALDIWRFATHFTATRVAPKRNLKYPQQSHDVVVTTSGLSYQHTYRAPDKMETLVRQLDR